MLFSLGPQGGGAKPSDRHLFFIDDLSTAATTSTDNCMYLCYLEIIILSNITSAEIFQVDFFLNN